MPKKAKLFGFEVGEPYPSELDYFKSNPKTSGMATDDGRIILNPYSGLSPEEYQSVAVNEAARLYMRKNNINPDFELTKEQLGSFRGTPYENDQPALRQTLVGRALSGDPSAGKLTPQQMVWVEMLRRAMGVE